jgi:hypothetical protein
MTTQQQQGTPSWFILAAIAVLLWELVGCAMYLMRMAADPASLPVDERAIWDTAPMWMMGAYGVAVWTGLAGAILLLLRRRLAATVLLVSFLAVVVQFSALLLVPDMRNLMNSDLLFLPFVILVVCFVIWKFAHISKNSGWLR